MPPSQPLPGTCDELGTASALSHGQQSLTGAVSPGDSGCHGGPTVGSAAPSPASALTPRETEARSSPGVSSAEGTSRGGPLLGDRSGAKLAEEGGGGHYGGFGGVGVPSSIATRQCGAGGVVLCPSPPMLPPLSRTDSTDFQESFVTSGVFSVTELIQVSRSEYHRDATTPPNPQLPGHGSVPTAPLSRLRAGAPRNAEPSLSPLSPHSAGGDRHGAKLLPGGAAGPPGL